MAEPAARQPFVKPDGSVVTLEPQDFQAAQNMGYKPYDPAAKKPDFASDHPIEAFSRGVLDTATGGLSTAALNGIEGGNQVNRQLAEENPIARPAGQIAGFLVPTPAGALAGGAGKAASVAAKAAPRLASGITEGGIWGLGSAISEDAMGDPQQAGEHYAAGILGGALAGGVLNPVLGKVGDVGKSVLMKAFGGQAIQDKLGAMAEEQVMRTIATPSDMLRRNMKSRSSEVARQALDEGLVGGFKTTAQGAGMAAEKAQQAYADVLTGIEAADMTGAFVPDHVSVRMQPIIDEMKGNPAMSAIKDRIESLAEQFKTENGNAPKTFQKAWETTQDMLASIGPAEPKGLKSELFKVRKVLQDEVFAQANSLNPGLGDQIQAANRQYANFASFKELAGKAATRNMGDHGNGLLDAIGLFTRGPMGLVEGAAINAGRTAVRERGGFAMASALDAIAQNKTFGRIADALQKTVQHGLESSPAFGGPFRAMLETASADGAQKLMETHLRLANTEPSYLMSVNMPPETPGVVPEYADKAHRLGQLYQAVDNSGAAVDASIQRFLGTKAGRAPEVENRNVTAAEFADLKQKLKTLQNSNQINPKISEIAPSTAMSASMATGAAAKYLLDKAPIDPNENKPVALQRPWQPGADELRRWSRCVSAVANPLLVLEQMREGRVTPEALDAVKTVYPRIFADFQAKLQDHLAQMTTPLDRTRLQRANQILEDPGDRDIDALIQGIHAASIPQQAPKKPDARQDVDQTKNQMTQAQRLEGKDDEEA